MKFAMAACAALPFLAGCRLPEVILYPDSAEGIGSSTMAQVFNGAAAQKSCVVNANDLKSNTSYNFKNGALTINGNIPDHARIYAQNAKIFINGNVPGTASIHARVPINTRTEITLIPMWTGQTMALLPQSESIFDGYKYETDHDPALTINGDVATAARLTSNHGIRVTGKLGDASIKHIYSDSYNKLQTGPAAAPAF